MNLTKKDIKHIKEQGLTIEKAYKQLESFIKGIPFVNVLSAAAIGNGIEAITKKEQLKLVAYYNERKDALEIIKFVPASGAATRMFQFLFQFLEDYNPETQPLEIYLKDKNNKTFSVFINSINDFAFLDLVNKKIKQNYPRLRAKTEGDKAHRFVKTMLAKNGLNFGNLPKGLIPFHKYGKCAVTAFQEHLYEAAHYASVNKSTHLHFTFSEKHVPFFKNEFETIKKRVSKKTKTEFHISYSFQDKKTDTLAVNNDNTLFRDKKEEAVFRPSGHGALIENLNKIDADLVFIKNIDNVMVAEYAEEIAYYKKLLAGKLLWIQEKIFNYLEIIFYKKATQEILDEIKLFLKNELNIKKPSNNAYLIAETLNRPLRVCGVVKNTGAPGGGPFWVKNNNEEISLQIIEMAQIDPNNADQQKIVSEATHFNPVDIVCGMRDYKGDKFNLCRYIDSDAGIISQKSQDGKPLKALELPGLWNGAMAGWNSVFVEVPLHTFNPVKTVNDLLKKEHQPSAE